MARFDPIGHVRCAQRYRYEAPRQGVLQADNRATIELIDDQGYEEALTGLHGFERIWVVFEFHLNESWQSLVQPPHEGAERRGVFATRSPHRPNRIGLSCVRLLEIDGLTLHIAGHDLLDATPVLDIKPYVPYADGFPDVAAGWLDEIETTVWDVRFEEAAAERIRWVQENAGLDCENFARVQLSEDPTDGERKRIVATDDGYTISYRTWRLDYCVDADAGVVMVTGVRSGYSEGDLASGADVHGDKDVHRAFRLRF